MPQNEVLAGLHPDMRPSPTGHPGQRLLQPCCPWHSSSVAVVPLLLQVLRCSRPDTWNAFRAHLGDAGGTSSQDPLF